VLAFTSVYFSESGLFNGLRAKKIKKFSAALIRAAGCARDVPAMFISFQLARPEPRQGLPPMIEKS
jgi:hypothetical protein